jgi:hypothetical protein
VFTETLLLVVLELLVCSQKDGMLAADGAAQGVCVWRRWHDIVRAAEGRSAWEPAVKLSMQAAPASTCLAAKAIIERLRSLSTVHADLLYIGLFVVQLLYDLIFEKADPTAAACSSTHRDTKNRTMLSHERNLGGQLTTNK